MESSSTYLVMFSGGKDSFLTACRLLNKGNKVKLLSFNGGGVIGEQNLLHGVNRLLKKYGEDNVEYVGIYPTISIIQRINRTWVYATQKELGEKYPSATNCQFQCLHCQTAMWIAAIAYCQAKEIKHIACGYRSNDVFCTGITEYMDEIKKIASQFDIDIVTPVSDIKDDLDRDFEMSSYGFAPQVLEPKCVLGNPAKDGLLSNEERTDLMSYFSENLYYQFDDAINSLIPMFSVIRIGNKSFEDNCF